MTNRMIVPPESVTSSNLNYIVMGMDANDKLILSPQKDGRVAISIKTKGKHEKQLRNRMSFVLRPEPVRRSWMPMALEDDGTGRHAQSVAKKAAAHKASKEKDNLKGALKQAFSLALAFMTLEDAIATQEMSMSTYLKFKVAEYFVYTRLDMRPVMYTEGEGGELVYL